MNVLHVEYHKPYSSELKDFPGCSWRFSALTDEVFPHGHSGFDGVLRRIPDGEGYVWQARHFGSTDWAAPALGREAAIKNLAPIAFEAIKNWKITQNEDDARVQARYAEANTLREALQEIMPFITIKVGVNARKDGHVASQDPLEFVFEFSKLSKEQAQAFIAVLKAVNALGKRK